jgi:phage tail tube protein FII
MPNPLLVMEQANLYCGTAPSAEQASNHLALVSVQLPTLEMQFIDHRAGGAPVSTEVDVIQTRLECKFEILGLTPQIMVLMGRHLFGGNPLFADALAANNMGSTDYYIFGHIRNYGTGEAVQSVAYLRGQLGQVEMQPFRHGAAPMTTRYSIRSIVKYKFELAGQPIYEWDFFNNRWAIGGFDQNGTQIVQQQPTVPVFRQPSRLVEPPDPAIVPSFPSFPGFL